MSGRLSQNSPAGRRSHIRVVRPVDVAAVLLHTEARAFTRRALTRLPLGVRPTAFRGPGNSVRRHNRAAFLRFVQKQSQDEGGSNRPYRPLTGIPAARLEKIETGACGVSLETLQKLAATTAEGKRLAARIFQIDYETQAELHALLVRATKLAGGGV